MHRVCEDTEFVAKSWTWILQPIPRAAVPKSEGLPLHPDHGSGVQLAPRRESSLGSSERFRPWKLD